MNVPAILSISKVLRDPCIVIPHAIVPTFNQLPVPLSSIFESPSHDKPVREIRAVVLDKDNCFAIPKRNEIYPEYTDKFRQIIDHYKPSNVLIVSNSSGLHSQDPDGKAADALELATGVKVLRHVVRKPACGAEILAHFKDQISSPAEIAVIGDRLFTDVLLANTMGARAIWIRSGVIPDRGFVTKFEYGIVNMLHWRGYKAPNLPR